MRELRWPSDNFWYNEFIFRKVKCWKSLEAKSHARSSHWLFSVFFSPPPSLCLSNPPLDISIIDNSIHNCGCTAHHITLMKLMSNFTASSQTSHFVSFHFDWDFVLLNAFIFPIRYLSLYPFICSFSPMIIITIFRPM